MIRRLPPDFDVHETRANIERDIGKPVYLSGGGLPLHFSKTSLFRFPGEESYRSPSFRDHLNTYLSDRVPVFSQKVGDISQFNMDQALSFRFITPISDRPGFYIRGDPPMESHQILFRREPGEMLIVERGILPKLEDYIIDHKTRTGGKLSKHPCVFFLTSDYFFTIKSRQNGWKLSGTTLFPPRATNEADLPCHDYAIIDRAPTDCISCMGRSGERKMFGFYPGLPDKRVDFHGLLCRVCFEQAISQWRKLMDERSGERELEN